MIYRNSGEVSGQPPLNFKNYSGSIQDYLIEGNTSQNGTPTPDAPVDVQGVGEKTRNLFDYRTMAGTIKGYYLDSSGNLVQGEFAAITDYIPCSGGKFSLAKVGGVAASICLYDSAKQFLYGQAYNTSSGTDKRTIIVDSALDASYIRFTYFYRGDSIRDDLSSIMLNIGSTAKPYEPYGYKLPPKVNGIEYPIYLGQVPTTRRIKKLVLTGEENITSGHLGYNLFNIPISDYLRVQIIGVICTHYKAQENVTEWSSVSNKNACFYVGAVTEFMQLYIRDSSYSTIADFKSFLASEYSAGHPVTVWYALAEPETAIINEPLHKIGNYADTISKSQSNLPIPTISGQNTLTIPTTISPSNVSLTLDQKEIEKIYEGGKKEVELSGVPPISFNAIGSQLEDYLIEGNTSQNGTPSPTNPVEVIGCGEKTENLFDKENLSMIYSGYINNVTSEVTSSTIGSLSIIVPVKPNSNYTISKLATTRFRVGLFANYPVEGSIATATYGDREGAGIDYGTTLSFSTSTDTAYIMVFIKNYNDTVTQEEMLLSVMVNEGSTALPYEPYGYKLPITCGGVTTPIYLGSCQTTRQIRKLVLTGNESGWVLSGTGLYYNLTLSDNPRERDVVMSTHFAATHEGILPVGTFRFGGSQEIPINPLVFNYDRGTIGLEAFKSWLAAQYANGTPVTVWYVPATPETAIVNEPFMKIGNYADSISKTQSNLPIPITTGSNTLSIETTIQPSSITINYNKQTEIAEVYGGIGENYPIYYMNRTIEGTSPIMFKGLGKDLKDYAILGDTSQNGTPTPNAPVDVQGCGVRTENLFDVADVILGYHINNRGEIESKSNRMCTAHNIDLTGISEVTLNFQTSLTQGVSVIFALYSAGALVSRMASVHAGNTIDVSSGDSCLIAFYSSASIEVNTQNTTNIMLNLGSTPLPYEPYGYKLPPTVNGTEYPIYLGQVPTTRRIMKLVLDGTENWSNQSVGQHGAVSMRKDELPLTPNMPAGTLTILSTHFKAISNSKRLNIGEMVSGSSYLNFDYDGTNNPTTFKSYLSAQYANGTPVTVWYVLAEPETGIVNEPLHKIGDYADTITMAQAGVTIPTVSGSNVLDITSTVKSSAVSITGNIKPTGYGQLLDVNDVDIQDSNGTPIFIQG